MGFYPLESKWSTRKLAFLNKPEKDIICDLLPNSNNESGFDT
jgi:hypothetical protein